MVLGNVYFFYLRNSIEFFLQFKRLQNCWLDLELSFYLFYLKKQLMEH